MKVLLLNGSPKADRTTYTALNEVAKALNEESVETEIIHVCAKPVGGCIDCRSCKKTGKCVFNDIVNEVAAKFKDADGIVIGSPVYYGSANGNLISFLDRLFFSSGFDKTMKVGASVVTARRAGTTATFDELNKYFTISGMPVASSLYWNNVHGGLEAEDTQKDAQGMQVMRTLGRNMAFLIKSIALGKEKYGLPKKEEAIFTRFID